MTKAPERVFASKQEDGSWRLADCAETACLEFIEFVPKGHAIALVAAAYEDAADSIQKFGVTPLVDAGHDSAPFFVATYGRDVARARTPDDATAALERVKQEVAEQAAKLADEWYHNSGHGSPGDEIRAAFIRKG